MAGPTSGLYVEAKIKSWNDVALKTKVRAGVMAAFDKWGRDVLENAQMNVYPGRGPGPHPHRTPHEDTGALAAGIQKWVTGTTAGPRLDIGFSEPYGLYLEMGWHAPSGVFYRFPWLWPAIEATRPQLNFYMVEMKL